MIALGDDAAVLEGGRCFRIHSRINAGLDVLQRIDFLRQFRQFRAIAGQRLLLQIRQTVTGLRQRIDLLGRGGTVDCAGHQTLDVRDVVQLVGQVAAGHGLAHQAFHGVQTAVDEFAGNERLFAPLFAAPQSLGQFQIGPGDWRQPHELGFVVGHHSLQALHTLDLGVVEVFQQRCHRKPHQAVCRHAGALGPAAAELVLQRRRHQAGRIALILHQLHRAGHILFDVGRHFTAVQQAGVHQHLAGMVAA